MDVVTIQSVSVGDSVKIGYVGDRTPQGNMYSISWHLLNGGNPRASGDYISLWQSDGKGNIQPGNLIFSRPINTSVTDGEIKLEADIGMEEYVFGYSQCGKPLASTSPMVSATLSIPAGKFDLSKVVSSNTSMQLQQDDFSLALKVAYPSNFDPVTGTWIGIFEDKIVLKNKKYTAPCKDIFAHESPVLTLAINDFQMVRNTEYVIGFFVNGWTDSPESLNLKALATWLRFST
jgi:hypothetical protein